MRQVFEDTQPVVLSVLDGYNVCIFAYGQVHTLAWLHSGLHVPSPG